MLTLTLTPFRNVNKTLNIKTNPDSQRSWIQTALCHALCMYIYIFMCSLVHNDTIVNLTTMCVHLLKEMGLGSWLVVTELINSWWHSANSAAAQEKKKAQPPGASGNITPPATY